MIIVNNYDKNGNKINPSDIKITDMVIYERSEEHTSELQSLA